MKKNTGLNVTRKFGIEIEFGGVDRYTAMEALNNAGIRVAGQPWTNHGNRDYSQYEWKMTTDGSVSVNGYGNELVSPPMTIEGGAFEEIRRVCEVLNTVGAAVNKSCGLHVHHDAHEFDIKAFKQLFTMYVRYESAIDELMPPSRRGNDNSYCKSLNRYGYDETLDQIAHCKNVEDISRVYGCSRYFKLNVQSFMHHGTIEFRQHDGTVNADKMISWILITQAMVNRATEATVQSKGSATDWFNFKKVIRAYKWMGASDELVAAVDYFNKRRQKFAKTA